MKNNNKTLLFILMFFVSTLASFSFFNPTSLLTSNTSHIDGIIKRIPLNFNIHSRDNITTTQWIKNPYFDPPIIEWFNSTSGDLTDIDLTEDVGFVNYVTIGKNGTRTYSFDPSQPDDWVMMHDPDHPTFPNETTSGSENGWCWIDNNGAFANHSWQEDAANQLGQDPGVIWKRNVTLPINITDYTITSASLSTNINASPLTNPEFPGEGDYPGRGDFVRFFVRISDLSGNYTYEIANYLKEGRGNLNDIPMNNVTKKDLMFFLSSVLSKDGYNFTITMGINFWCEDNYVYDDDEWGHTYIKSLDLKLTYEKKINQFTSARWSQISDKLNVTGENFVINKAKLNFLCKLDSLWPDSSPNSEIIIKINNNTHSERVKLSTVNKTFQEAKYEGFDVTNLLVKYENVSLSLEVMLADAFELSKNITLSIDNVTLNITLKVIETVKPFVPIFPYQPEPTDWSWLIILLSVIITVLLTVIGAYVEHYKYPPMIRKIRKLKRNIKKGKTIKPIPVDKKDTIIQNHMNKILKLSNIGYYTPPPKPKGEKVKNKLKLLLFCIFLFIILLFTIFSASFSELSLNPSIIFNGGNFKPFENSNYDLNSKDYQEIKQWIKNPSFNPPISQYWNTSQAGDISDTNLSAGIGYINYNVIGDQGIANYKFNRPNASDWVLMHNPDYPLFPNVTYTGGYVGFDKDGILANHTWDELDPAFDQVGQDPSGLWKRNESAPKNMSDYQITSASLSAIFNVSADSNIDILNDPEGNPVNTSDHVRFYVRISDLSGNHTYEVASYKYENQTYLNDTYMIPVPKENLIFYLSSIFEESNNFTITMGINFFCEDNVDPRDTDVWYYARIKSLNLSFSYEKRINQNARGYWSQIGDKLNGRDFNINEARLYFQYKIDTSWPGTSLNSEFRIVINDNIHSETIRLSTANQSFQDANPNGFDVTNLMVKNESIKFSLEIYLADNFLLDENITLSVDNVLLYINRTIVAPPPVYPA
ncbi:MAG: hypothetical protein ACFFDN_41250, partial [Candidatus Hodarchaeota archaeon]